MCVCAVPGRCGMWARRLAAAGRAGRAVPGRCGRARRGPISRANRGVSYDKKKRKWRVQIKVRPSRPHASTWKLG